MMKPFDLEAAKRGEPICSQTGDPYHFVGLMSDGRVVIERAGNLLHMPDSELCMAPSKRTVYLVVQRGSHAGTWTDDKAKAEQDAIERGEWCGDVGSFVVIPVEIER